MKCPLFKLCKSQVKHLKFLILFSSSLFPALSLPQSTELPGRKDPCEPSGRSISLPSLPLPPTHQPGLTVRNNPKLFSPLPRPLPARSCPHSLIKETMNRTHQDILVRTVISSNKLLPHLVTFMGQGNHMAHAASSRSTPAKSMLIRLILIVLKDCGVPNSKVFHHPYSHNACSSLSMTKLPSFLSLLSPFHLLTLRLGLWCLGLPLPAFFGDSLVEGDIP